ncbi:MAG TPA: trehalase family glycosidase [Armatimonadota bacterium]|jgi:putative isomerase
MSATTPYRYPVNFDPTIYHVDPKRARGPITVSLEAMESLAIVKDHLAKVLPGINHEPCGNLHHPYVVPGANYHNLWDWDSYFICSSLPPSALPYGKGTVMNLIEGIRADGMPSKLASTEGTYSYDQHPYPLLAQFSYIMARQLNDFSWIVPIWEKLKSALQWYETQTIKNGHYFTWQGLMGNGIDNNPAVYGRPPWSSAGIDLATWHYREYRAYAKISEALNTGESAVYHERAERLRALIQRQYWDHIDRSYYNLDMGMDTSQISQQAITWVTHLKFRSWATLFPLWGKLATTAQAAIMRDRIMDVGEFLAPCGVRSHSAIDPLYNNVPMGHPSNWQGPVWGLSTFLTAYGLAKYGYTADALEVAFRLIRTFAADITQNGCIHEYYHGDTGQPLTSPGFISWNLLALRVIDDIQHGVDGTTLDLLETDDATLAH